MSVKKRIYDVLHSVVVVGLVVDFFWRWRKGFYWAIGLLWAYRLLFMASVIAAAVYVALVPTVVRAQAQYPGGTRNPSEWYYCFAEMYNGADNVAVPWGPIECQHILWQNPGGTYESQIMNGGVSLGGVAAGEYASIRGFVVAPQGMKSMTYACNGQVEYCHLGTGTGSVAGSVLSNAGAGFTDDATDFSISASVPGSGPTCNTNEVDVVGSFRATSYDKYWSPDIAVAWTSVGSSAGTYFEVTGNVSNDKRTFNGIYQCQIIDYENWPQWLVDHDPWVPGPGDLVIPDPTPAPTGTWDIIPWVPITNPVNFPEFELGPGEDGGCFMLIPEQSLEIGGNQYGWYGFEVCRTDFSLTLGLFGEDFNALLNVALSLGMLGIVYSIFKRA